MNEESKKINRTSELPLAERSSKSTMSDNVESPTVAMGGLSMYSPDVDIPEYVSSVGSSVSQGKEGIVAVNAAMFENAMNVIMNLQSQVFF